MAVETPTRKREDEEIAMRSGFMGLEGILIGFELLVRTIEGQQRCFIISAEIAEASVAVFEGDEFPAADGTGGVVEGGAQRLRKLRRYFCTVIHPFLPDGPLFAQRSPTLLDRHT